LINTTDEVASTVLNKSSRGKVDLIKASMDEINSYVDPKPNLGVKVESKLADIPAQQAKHVRQICLNFTLKLVSELKNQLPANMEQLKYVKELSIENVRKKIKKDITKDFLDTFGVPDRHRRSREAMESSSKHGVDGKE